MLSAANAANSMEKHNLDHLRCVFCLLKDGTARDDLTGRGAIRQKDAQSPVYSIHKISSADKHLPIFFRCGEKKDQLPRTVSFTV